MSGTGVDLLDLLAEWVDEVCAAAIWSRDQCVWVVDVDVPGDTYRVTGAAGSRLCGGTLPGHLYGGTAGLAAALAEVAALTGDTAVLRTASGAARHAAASVREGTAPGFHTGLAGIGYVCALLGTYTADPALAEVGVEVMGRALDGPENHTEVDLLSGTSGAITAAVAWTFRSGNDSLIPAAHRAAEIIAERARPQFVGRCWSRAPDELGLTGISHGTAGVYAALGGLSTASGDARWLKLVAEALEHEDYWFNEAASNWADLRWSDPSLTAPGSAPTQRLWCHGAPGILLARHSLPAEVEVRHVEAAAITTREALASSRPTREAEFGLCHGAAGLAEILSATDRLGPAERQLSMDNARSILLQWREIRDTSALGLMTGAPGGVWHVARLLGSDVFGSLLLPLADSGSHELRPVS